MDFIPTGLDIESRLAALQAENQTAPDQLGREAFLELPYFDHMHRFLPALVQRAGGAVVSVEVSHRPRTRGTSKYGIANRLWVGIVDLLGVMWLRRRSRVPRVSGALPPRETTAERARGERDPVETHGA